ncbi:MAG TPA: prepilin-type N-terminal cleavage/methylation domain-containing protein [Luteimonas sp.]|nr:prepilin-type N-terminal cleavage/methylation domain-containing protein [Luteimonas sp.]
MNKTLPRRTFRGPRQVRGVTLIELMIALVLGLVVTGAALALFVTNRQTYTASENLNRMQETARSAFELMSRDIREAATNPCDSTMALTNQLKDSTTRWWTNWSLATGVQGYTATTAFPDDGFGTAEKKRVNGTAAIEFKSAVPTGVIVSTDMANTSSPITVNNTTGVSSGDILAICDFNHGTIFQATSTGAGQINHVTSGSPGNIDSNLPPDIYKKNAIVARVRASRWYVGNNANGGTSLYQASLINTAGVPGVTVSEVADGVTDLELTYLSNGGAAYQAAPANWADVAAVKIEMTLAGKDKVSTDGTVLTRTFEHVVAIRSRAL